MEQIEKIPQTIESLMVQEFLALKEKNENLERENATLKQALLIMKQDKTCMLAMLAKGFSDPTIKRDETGNVIDIYSGGGSVTCPNDFDEKTFDTATLTRVGKMLEDARAEYNNNKNK